MALDIAFGVVLEIALDTGDDGWLVGDVVVGVGRHDRLPPTETA
jgi:hypothetical protein